MKYKNKILFVDDEAPLRRTMAMGLSQQGYDTEPCDNGMNALKKLETYVKNNINLDAVVVDIRLPDIDGIKLVKIIKFKYPGIPVILISGYADQYSREEIRHLKVNAFLEKPVSPEQLSHQFKEILSQSKKTAEEPVREKNEAYSVSSYLLINVEDDADFFETYRSLYTLPDVVYCDATKGDYDILMLIQSDSAEGCARICEDQVKKVPGVRSVEMMEISAPVLEESTQAILRTVEDALGDEEKDSLKSRDMSQRVSSYILLEVEREKLDQVYPALRLDESVVFCDYTTGRYNLVLFVTGAYFAEIDRFISGKILTMEGVLKVKEYPVISLFEM